MRTGKADRYWASTKGHRRKAELRKAAKKRWADPKLAKLMNKRRLESYRITKD